MRTITAKVYFLPVAEGGLQDTWFPGMMPSFNIDGNLIMCKFEPIDGSAMLIAGVDHDVSIEIPQSELIEEHLNEGARFSLNSGGHVVARGVISSIERS